jgi:hypothetical protein
VHATGEHDMVAFRQRIVDGVVFGNKGFLRLGIRF